MERALTMTGIEEAAKVTGTTEKGNRSSNTNNGSKFPPLLRSSSSSSTQSGGLSRKRVGRSKSLSAENEERSQLEVCDKKSLGEKYRNKKDEKKENGVFTKSTISSEDEALFQSQRRRRKKLHDNGVTFGFVQIREHAITIGDNPGGYKGPPLSIEWEAQNEVKMPIDDYEGNRPIRRSGAQMNIPSRVREQMLLDAGHSMGQIREALRDVTISRHKRRRTIEILNLSNVHEFTERIFRGSLNFTVRRGTKNREREYLKKAWDVHRQMEEMNLDDGKASDEDYDEKEQSSDDVGDQ